MLTEVIIQTSTPTSLKLNAYSPDEILVLESISGLSDVKVNQFMGDFAREGSYYQGRRAERRNPVFNFKIHPNYALDIRPNEIREILYRMFMEPSRDSDAVQVALIDDKLPERYFIGYTETIQAEMFAKDMKAQCSLMTTDAYIRSAEMTHRTNEQGWFYFPMLYEGSADTGFKLKLRVLYTTPSLTIENGADKLKLNYSFVAGDILEVSTVQGEWAIVINGEDRMAAMTPDSKWLSLRERGNSIAVYGGSDTTDRCAVVTEYSYRAAWWGI